MRKKIITYLLSIALLISVSCNNDDDTTEDCQVKNYGILKVNFAAANVRHSVLVTVSGTATAREKIIATGKVSDTLHLFSGSYTASIASLNDSNQAIESESKAVAIKNCTTTEVSVNF